MSTTTSPTATPTDDVGAELGGETRATQAEAVTAESTSANAAPVHAADVPAAAEAPLPEAAKIDDPQPVIYTVEDASHGDEATKLRAERDALVDRLARLQAEFENARRRAERERAEFREYAVAGAVEQFLPVLDNFALALKATGSADQLRTGVELIVKQMEEVLRGLNVQPVETIGAQFDPRFHEALGSVEAADQPDGQVAEEVRRGYRIRERLLRPALVRVVSNPQQKSDRA